MICDDEIGTRTSFEHRQRLGRRDSLSSRMSEVFEHGDGARGDQWIIIDHEDHAGRQGRRFGRRRAVLRRHERVGRGLRQPDIDCRALAQLARNFEGSAGLSSQAVDHGQAQSGALADPLCGEEGLRGLGKRFGVHSRTCIDDAEADVFSWRKLLRIMNPADGLARSRDRQRPARRTMQRLSSPISGFRRGLKKKPP